MLDCLILGDSIAVGTHQFMPECRAYATGGLNSHQWNHRYLGNKLTAETVIISLGTNDHQYVKTNEELLRMREQVKGKNVDRKSTRLNSSHTDISRMPSSA